LTSQPKDVDRDYLYELSDRLAEMRMEQIAQDNVWEWAGAVNAELLALLTMVPEASQAKIISNLTRLLPAATVAMAGGSTEEFDVALRSGMRTN
jgi:hypothetical protein